MSSKFAFVIFARDKEKYVARAMRSAFGQTHKGFEIVVSYQESQDKTWDVIQQEAADYRGENPLTILKCPIVKWKGMPGLNQHLNWIVENVDATHFIACAADDFSLPTRVAKTVDAFEKHSPSMVATGMYFADPCEKDGIKYGGENGYPEADGWVRYEDIFPRYIGGSTTQAWTREFYEKIGGLDGVGSPDIVMPFLACLDKGLYYLNERLHTYCRIVGVNNTGLQSVMDAYDEGSKERLAVEELIHFQVLTGIYTCLGKGEKAGLITTLEQRGALLEPIGDRLASWVNVRQRMTFEDVQPMKFKAV